jgi:hypothetical protein
MLQPHAQSQAAPSLPSLLQARLQLFLRAFFLQASLHSHAFFRAWQANSMPLLIVVRPDRLQSSQVRQLLCRVCLDMLCDPHHSVQCCLDTPLGLVRDAITQVLLVRLVLVLVLYAIQQSNARLGALRVGRKELESLLHVYKQCETLCSNGNCIAPYALVYDYILHCIL